MNNKEYENIERLKDHLNLVHNIFGGRVTYEVLFVAHENAHKAGNLDIPHRRTSWDIVEASSSEKVGATEALYLSKEEKDKIYTLLMEYRTFILTNKVSSYSERQLVEQFMYWNERWLRRWIRDLNKEVERID